MARATPPLKTKSRHEAVWQRQTFKWTLTRQARKTGNLFILFNWQGWCQGASCTFLLEKRANRTTWWLSMKPDGLTGLTHHSAISPHSFSSSACSSGIGWHPACSSAFQQKGAVSTPRHILVALATFYNPTYQLNFSTRCFQVLQYSWKKKNSALISYGCQ